MGCLVYAVAFLMAMEPEPALGNGPEIKAEEIRALVEKSRTFWEVPGCAVVLVHQGKTVFLSGFGVSQAGKPAPVTAESLFPLASCTKGFTSTLAASLVSKNKIAWEGRVQQYLPWFQLKDPLASADCRVRDLFCHRCGLESHDLLWYRSGQAAEALVKKLALLDAAYPFRSSFRYQSMAYAAGGLVCQQASGKPWEELIQEEIFSPLGMRDSTCKTPTVKMASGHRLNSQGNPVPVPAYPFSLPDPSNSIYTNAQDLGRWLSFQAGCYSKLKKGDPYCREVRETHQGQVVLPWDEFHKKTHRFTRQMTYGMGWVIQDYRGMKMVSHAGAIDGFRAHLMLIPEKEFALGLLANLEQTPMNLALSNSLVDLVFHYSPADWDREIKAVQGQEQKAMADQWLEKKQKLIADNPRPIPATGAVGKFHHPAYGVATLEKAGGNYRFHLGELQVELAPLGGSVLGAIDFTFGNPLMALLGDSNGKVSGLSVGGRLNVVFQKKD